jgi:hypothetical protein
MSHEAHATAIYHNNEFEEALRMRKQEDCCRHNVGTYQLIGCLLIYRLLSLSTTRDRPSPPFLRLPFSVRQHIYRYVLGGIHIRVCDPKNCRRSHRCRSRARKLHCPVYFHLRRCHLTLLSTCRQIHSETKLLPFSLNEFDGEYWDMHLAVFYRLSDAQVNAIANIRIYIGYQDVYSKPNRKTALPVWKMGSHLTSTLQALGRLGGLRRLAIQWAGQHSGNRTGLS